MPEPVRASDVPLREQGPLLVTHVTARIELRSLDEFVEAEKLIALRDLIEERVHAVEFELDREWVKQKPPTTRKRSEEQRAGVELVRDGIGKTLDSLKQGQSVTRDELLASAGGKSWRQLAPIVRGVVKRGGLVDNGDGTYTRTDAAL